jgi:predicted nucleic acid-binding protein
LNSYEVQRTLTLDDDLAGLFNVWAELERLGTAGNLTTDVHLAVLAMERGYVLYSTDTDFSRVSGLRWVNPCTKARGS